jgi:hypothetical protein
MEIGGSWTCGLPSLEALEGHRVEQQLDCLDADLFSFTSCSQDLLLKILSRFCINFCCLFSRDAASSILLCSMRSAFSFTVSKLMATGDCLLGDRLLVT